MVGIAAAVLLAAILAISFGPRIFASREPAPGPPAPPPGTFRPTPQQLKTLTVEAVGKHAFVSEELTEGKIGANADHATAVFTPFSGRITRVIAGPGDTVKAGAALATVESPEFVQAQNDIESASTQIKLARINETRKHALYEAKGGSLQDWQSAQADLTTAETTLNSVRNRLRILGKSSAEITAMENNQKINPVATLVAPIGGVVIDRQLGPGQYIQAGGGPVYTIADPSSVWLLANVRESDAGLVKLGDPVEVRVLAYPKRTFKARVTYVAAVVDPATHRLPVRAEIDNHDRALKPEMFATFRILTDEPVESPAVPQSAIVYEGASAHAWVVGDDGLISYRSIRPGRSEDGLLEVLDGLKAGERIVTKGGLFIDQVAAPASS
jgi:cobalt-zinc-cadmium efflux system membrane fusion protein